MMNSPPFRATSQLFQPLAPSEDRTNRNLQAFNYDHADRLLQECSIPTALFQAPRTHEHAVLNHHGPNADDAMRLGARANSENLRVAYGGYHIFGETSLRFHGLRCRTQSQTLCAPLCSMCLCGDRFPGESTTEAQRT